MTPVPPGRVVLHLAIFSEISYCQNVKANDNFTSINDFIQLNIHQVMKKEQYLRYIYIFKASLGILGQVWYLIVSIPDLCNLTYFNES